MEETLAAQLAEAQAVIVVQTERILQLEVIVRDLRARLEQNSSNSSKPPSSDAPWNKPGHKKKSGSAKPSGGQPGHQAHPRPLLPIEAVDEIVHHVPTECRHCANAFAVSDTAGDVPQRHQVSELPPVKVRVTEHQLHSRSCTSCGKITRAELPAEVPKSTFGPHLQAEVAHLIAECRLSRRGLVKYAAASWGTAISLGSVHGIEQNVARALAEPYAEALEAVKAASVRYADETGWRQSAKRGWLWTIGCDAATVFVIAESRSAKVFSETMGEAVKSGFFVSDRYRGYRVVEMKRRGICHAHLKRDFTKIEEVGGFFALLGAALAREHALMFELWHRFKNGELNRRELRRALTPIKRRMRVFLKSGRDGSDRKVAGMCSDILHHWQALWTFASVEGMDPTNNVAERSLRKAVLWRKNCFGTRSSAGSRFAERMLTVAETCRQNGRNSLAFVATALKALLCRNVAPRLLPAPSG